MNNQIEQKTFRDISNFIGSENNFLVTAHYSPDGDAVASILGMCEILKVLGKTAAAAVEGGLPEKYDFLHSKISILDPLSVEVMEKFSRVIILDAGSYERIGKVKEYIQNPARIINIDHHLSNDGFGEINYIDAQSSSVSEILYRFAQFMKIEFTVELASYLYMGIMTDTGRFRFSNTSAHALFTAGELIKLGADPAWLSEGVFFDLPRSYVEILGKCLNSLEYFDDGKIAVMEYMERKEIEDAEGLIDIAVGTKGVKAAAFIRAMEDGRFKVSLRSRYEADVREIAEKFGGGGHQKAAGFRFRGGLDTLRFTIIKELSQRLKEFY